MSLSPSLSRPLFRPMALVRLLSRPVQIAIAIGLGLLAAALFAQMEGERGVPPIASGGDFEVTGVKVDVEGRVYCTGPGGIYAKVLAGHNTIQVVGENVFVHGGVLPDHVTYGIKEINAEISEWMNILANWLDPHIISQ